MSQPEVAKPELTTKKEAPAGASKPSLDRIFFLGDVHIPFHDRRALELVLRALRGFKPSILVSIGDFVDLFSVSSFSKDPARAGGLRHELDEANKILDRIDKLAPAARRIYLSGNHEDRLRRYVQDRAPELGEFTDIPRELRLKDRGWEHVPYKSHTRIGKLNLTHDIGNAGRYSVFRCLDAFQTNIVTGHTHRLAYVVEGDATGGRQVSAQFGWLGDVERVDYMHRVKARRDWSLGFGYGYIERTTGYVYLVPVPIVKHTAIVEGRFYKT